jgi:hypothetical protein
MSFFRFLLIPTLVAGAAGAQEMPKSQPPLWAAKPDVAAFEKVEAEHLAEAQRHVDRLLAVTGKRTVENTLRPFDAALEQINQATYFAGLMQQVHPDAKFRDSATEMTRKASAAVTALALNRGVYQALGALDLTKADAATRHFVSRHLLQFRLAGVDKDDATRAKLKQLNDQLTEQQSTFDRNISDGQKVVRVSGRAALDGLPQDYIDRHKPAGDGTIQITTDYPDMLPALKFVKSDALRRQLFEAFDTRAYPKNRDVLKQMWTRNALVVCQVSLAFVLLIGSGLLTLSFMRLLAVDPGFQAQNVQTAQFSLPWARYKEDAQVRNFVGGLLERVRAIPGVTAAGATDAPPFTDRNNASAMAVEGYNPASGELPPVPRWSTIDAGYLAAMKIPLRAGRYFREGDTEATQKVVIIDEFLARKYWPEGKAVGGHIHRGIESKDAVATVIGIVGSVKSEDMADLSQRGEVYWNYKQQTQHTMHVVVKTAANDMQAVSAVRAALKQADPELPLFDVKTMPERVTHSVRDRKSAMVICMAFALLALTLSAIGIYGVLAYTVTQRTREFGIRMALGASAGDVVGMVVRHGLRLAAIGLGIGVAGALAITRLMTTMLYGVRPTDPLVFGSVAASLMAVAVAASVVPSLRISHIRPANALRYE